MDTCTRSLRSTLKNISSEVRLVKVIMLDLTKIFKNIDIAKKLLSILKSNSIIIGNNVKITFVKDRPGHDFRYALDCKKIHKKLKWKSRINLKKGLTDTFQWYLNNIGFFHKCFKKTI